MKNKNIENMKRVLLEFWAENKIRARIYHEIDENKEEVENAILAGLAVLIFGGIVVEFLFSTVTSFSVVIAATILYYLIFTSENKTAKRFRDYIDRKLHENKIIEGDSSCSKECWISTIDSEISDRDEKKFELMKIGSRTLFFTAVIFMIELNRMFEAITKSDIIESFNVIIDEPVLVAFVVLVLWVTRGLSNIHIDDEKAVRKQLKLLKQSILRGVFDEPNDILKEYLKIQDYEIMNTVQKVHRLSSNFKYIARFVYAKDLR